MLKHFIREFKKKLFTERQKINDRKMCEETIIWEYFKNALIGNMTITHFRYLFIFIIYSLNCIYVF